MEEVIAFITRRSFHGVPRWSGDRGCRGNHGRVPGTRQLCSRNRHDRGRPFPSAGRRLDRRHQHGFVPAESLIARRGSDLGDQLSRYVDWYRKGVNSSIGRCFDIGITTRDALNRFEQTGDPHSGPTGEFTAGNGSIMRLAPVILAYAHERTQAREQAAASSRTTHGAVLAVDGCRLMADILYGLLKGLPKEQVMAKGYYTGPPLEPRMAALAAGDWKGKSESDIRSTGFVLHSLDAALWAFATTSDFRSGCLRAVNLGGDADTIGAIYGQFAGACYGLSGIPQDWLDLLFERERLKGLAAALAALSDELRGSVSDTTSAA